MAASKSVTVYKGETTFAFSNASSVLIQLDIRRPPKQSSKPQTYETLQISGGFV